MYGMIAQPAGGIMQSIAANQVAQAMKAAFLRNIYQQQAYGQKMQNVFQDGLMSNHTRESADRALQVGHDTRVGQYAQANAMPMSLQGNTLTTSSQRDANATALAGEHRGTLGAYSDWQLQQMIKNIRTQDALNKLANFSQGDENLYQYKLYDAQHSQDKLAMAGALLSSFGGGAGGFSQFSQAPSGGQQGGY